MKLTEPVYQGTITQRLFPSCPVSEAQDGWNKLLPICPTKYKIDDKLEKVNGSSWWTQLDEVCLHDFESIYVPSTSVTAPRGKVISSITEGFLQPWYVSVSSLCRARSRGKFEGSNHWRGRATYENTIDDGKTTFANCFEVLDRNDFKFSCGHGQVTVWWWWWKISHIAKDPVVHEAWSSN